MEKLYYSTEEYEETEESCDERGQIDAMVREANTCLKNAKMEREDAKKEVKEKIQKMNVVAEKIKESIKKQSELTDQIIDKKNKHAAVLSQLQKHFSVNKLIHCVIEIADGNIKLSRNKEDVVVERDALFEKTVQLQRLVEQMKNEKEKNEQKIIETQRNANVLSEELRSPSPYVSSQDKTIETDEIVKLFEKSKIDTKRLLAFIKIFDNQIKPVQKKNLLSKSKTASRLETVSSSNDLKKELNVIKIEPLEKVAGKDVVVKKKKCGCCRTFAIFMFFFLAVLFILIIITS